MIALVFVGLEHVDPAAGREAGRDARRRSSPPREEEEGTDARQVPGQGTRRRRQKVHGVVLIDSMILPQVHLRNGEELCDSMLCLQSGPTIS